MLEYNITDLTKYVLSYDKNAKPNKCVWSFVLNISTDLTLPDMEW